MQDPLNTNAAFGVGKGCASWHEGGRQERQQLEGKGANTVHASKRTLLKVSSDQHYFSPHCEQPFGCTRPFHSWKEFHMLFHGVQMLEIKEKSIMLDP